ncbi:MAG: hypothetical protein ACXWJJ_00775 [Ramlibacter sp.]
MQTDPSSPGNASPQGGPSSFTLLFRPLFHAGRGFAFPCDPQGHVDLNAMSERARNNYFYARAMMGRELAFPSVHNERPAPLSPA